MKLYYFPLSTYSQKVLIALYEKGIEFEPEITNLFDPEVRAKYREIYPMGKVPLLLDDDYMVPESSIIIEYVDKMAGPRLIEGDDDRTRKIRFADRVYDLYLAESITTLLFQSWKSEDQRDPERIETAKMRVETMYAYMEKSFETQPFSNGSEFSMADCAAAAGLFYAEQVASFSERPNIVKYWKRLKTMPSVKRVHEEAAPYVEELAKRSAA